MHLIPLLSKEGKGEVAFSEIEEPFDGLRANGKTVKRSINNPFVLSPSKHEHLKNFESFPRKREARLIIRIRGHGTPCPYGDGSYSFSVILRRSRRISPERSFASLRMTVRNR